MALKMDLVGKASDPIAFSYTWKDVVLYALSVGAKADELDYLYEGHGPKVLPTFAVVPSFTSLLDVVSRVEAKPTAVLHGEQAIRLHRPIPPSATLRTRSVIRGIYDKGKGAVISVECNTVDEKGAPVFDNLFSIFVRGEGGFGGERGPEAEKADAPEGKAPDFELTEAVPAEQALLYRIAGGDLNPLHAEPAFAQKAGFDRPILHGLATFGYAGRAILRGACGGDPTRLRGFGARFSGVVFPGDTLTTRGWKVGDHRYVATVSNPEGKAVLTQGTIDVGELG
jgi:acyl dehydratase